MTPDTMAAAVIDGFGKPDVVSIRTVPVPRPDASEVLIAVHAAGIASWDVEMRGGWWPSGKPRFPLVLGSDGSGTIAAVGSRVRRFKVGDEVYAFSFGSAKGGFHAEYVAVPAGNTAHVPRTLDLLHAGAVPATGLTALQGIDDALGIERDEAIIIHGASGTIGSLALQFAKFRGARVLAVASGRDGVALVRRLGADAAVDGKRGSVLKAARDFAPDGVDAVLAFAGGPALTQCLDALRSGGRLAYPNGLEPAPRKRKGLKVTTYDADGDVQGFARLGRAIDATKLEVPIADTFPLTDIVKAYRRFEKGHTLGKVMLRMR